MLLLVNVCVSTSETSCNDFAAVCPSISSDTRKGLFEVQSRYQSNTVCWLSVLTSNYLLPSVTAV